MTGVLLKEAMIAGIIGDAEASEGLSLDKRPERCPVGLFLLGTCRRRDADGRDASMPSNPNGNERKALDEAVGRASVSGPVRKPVVLKKTCLNPCFLKLRSVRLAAERIELGAGRFGADEMGQALGTAGKLEKPPSG